MSVNNCTFSGNVGRDPEMTYTQGGMAITKCTLAVQQWKVKGKEVPPMWLNLVFFGAKAENFNEWVHKGDGIIVVGRLVEDYYTDKDGVGRKWLSLNVENFEITKRSGSGAYATAASGGYVEPSLGELEMHPF